VKAEAVWRPIIFEPSQVEELSKLRSGGEVRTVHDTLRDQLLGLMEARNPRLRELPAAERLPLFEAEMAAHLGGGTLDEYGVWVFYPWSGELVHLLPEEEYLEVRLNRNLNKITAAERARLANFSVGVVGLSVGNAVALTLAQEGVGGHLKLADFDILELGNMNRIRAGVHQLGLKKTVLAARQILEFNPWMNISLFHDGVNADNMDEFLVGDHALDVLVDECDSIEIKYLLRERARALGLPVVMEASDRGILDIERFDLEPDRPLFHGIAPSMDTSRVEELTTEEKVYYVMGICGPHNLSDRMGASLLEVERSIVTWPQLASDVVLGGASVTIALRHLALGHPLPSGRRILDIESRLNEREDLDPAEEEAPDLSPEVPELELEPLIRELLEEAILAPSGANNQPWHFYVDGYELWLTKHPERSQDTLDRDGIAMLAGIGASLESLRAAAAHREHHLEEELFPVEGASAIVVRVKVLPGFKEDPTELQRLHAQLRARHTNRRVAPSAPLTDEEAAAMLRSVNMDGARLSLLRTPEALDQLGAVVGESDRLRMLNDTLGEALMQELIFKPHDEVEVGISADTCELSALQQVILPFLSRPAVRANLRKVGGGERLTESSREALASSSAACLLSLEDEDPATIVRGGQAMQRVWLEAHALGLSFQPMGSLPYMARFLSDDDGIYDKDEALRLKALDGQFWSYFPEDKGRLPLMLFRLHRAQPAEARSGRLSLERCVTSGRPIELS
jgi:molybdopterin/thiamine biosynthesis adenylyltransferase/nitroreductase